MLTAILCQIALFVYHQVTTFGTAIATFAAYRTANV